MPDIDLRSYYQRFDLIKQTADQIKKDLDPADITIVLSGKAESAYHELFNQVKPVIEVLLNNDYHKLMNLLYRIDVPESEIAKARDSSDVDMHAAKLADCIIKRELQKVLIRNSYQSHQ